MNVLDTDHLSIILGGPSQSRDALVARWERPSSQELTTTIVSFEEQMRGWLAIIHNARTDDAIIRAYERLQMAQQAFIEIRVLPYNHEDQERFKRLRPSLRRLGTLDLRIACIALTLDATLLTRNLRDFQQVPGLKVEDWTI